MFICFFECQLWAIFHLGTLCPWKWFFFVENLILKKGHISGLAKIDSIFSGWNLRVAKFDFNYFRHFLIDFGNSCCHFAAKFLNFLKHPQLFQFEWFWKKLWPKIGKMINEKKCQFEQILKSSNFSRWIFKTTFSFLCIKSTTVKNLP